MKLESYHSINSVGASILVNAPAAEIYDHWVRVEEFPQFMRAVREVRRIEGDRFYWRVDRGGKEYESVLQIALRIPNRRMAWRTVSGAESSGVVGFDPLPGNKTLVSFKMKYAPESGWGDPADLLQRIKARLENFKNYIESLRGTTKETQN
ncbi:MAG: SRPBCC family protein [Chthoniobacter sp.]|uniref:SRPBCC family protein n=1 Tax=Chthoniobacter sp. TaxID=2510640 RepID=UPI0032AB30E4